MRRANCLFGSHGNCMEEDAVSMVPKTLSGEEGKLSFLCCCVSLEFTDEIRVFFVAKLCFITFNLERLRRLFD